MTLQELANRIGGEIIGDPGIEILGAAGIDNAQKGDITYLLDQSDDRDVAAIRASALILKSAVRGAQFSQIVCSNPQYGFALALEALYPRSESPAGISESAFIGDNVSIGDRVSIHPLASISSSSSIGNGVTVSSGTHIGEGAVIGDNTFLYPNVTVREKVRIGDNVIVHSGTVIGADGFGYVYEHGRHYKIPQVGSVIIEDDVEVGANVCIDRGTVGDTLIGSGTRIDNLVQIAHNVKIGKNCIIVAQAGISGSVEIGDGVILAGQVGVKDHVRIGNGAIIGAQSGVGNNIPEHGVYSGSPAIPHKTWIRAQSIFSKLPDLFKRIRTIEKMILKEDNSNDERK